MGNVPDEVTDIDLADYFSNIGEVLSAQIRGNDGGHYAFLEFAYPDDVHRVLSLAQDQPFEMCDQPLKVQPRRPKDQHQVRPFSCKLSVVTVTDECLACSLPFAGIPKQIN